ncbi:MAG: c-type cytochrome [Candidatus Cyclobacteriaceae bacterium M2_1C_046]
MISRINNILRLLPVAVLAVACSAEGDDTGYEFAPNMYHSVGYESLTQITDEDEGWLVDSDDRDPYGEYFNSNPLNPHGMTMREPAPNSVKRDRFLPYRYDKDSLQSAAENSQNPLTVTPAVLQDGKALYAKFCQHCHGASGEGDGAVAEIFAGIANLKSAAVVGASEGHIFHVITHGKGRMAPHASQINIEDRWKISAYVKELQK